MAAAKTCSCGAPVQFLLKANGGRFEICRSCAFEARAELGDLFVIHCNRGDQFSTAKSLGRVLLFSSEAEAEAEANVFSGNSLGTNYWTALWAE